MWKLIAILCIVGLIEGSQWSRSDVKRMQSKFPRKPFDIRSYEASPSLCPVQPIPVPLNPIPPQITQLFSNLEHAINTWMTNEVNL
jgi:hypothetical protein